MNMERQKNNKQKMSRHLHKVKKNTRTSRLLKQRKKLSENPYIKHLKKLKKPKVRLDLDKEDFSEDLQNHYIKILHIERIVYQ